MENKSSNLVLLTLLHLFVFFSLSASYQNFFDESSIAYTYNRVSEIEKHCGKFLSLASKLSPFDIMKYRIINELSFSNGDWEQENFGSPLMPFRDSELSQGHSLPRTSPLKLVSFNVKDINPFQHFENSVSLGGILSITISRDTSHFPSLQSPTFYMTPGFSILNIVFEGIYIETEEKGGQRLMCLSGNTTLPSPEPIDEYSDLADSNFPEYNHRSHVLQDDQILLVLQYPRNFNLTRRAIKGEMRSLNEQGSLKYFDNVYISSQLSHFSEYQFSSELKSGTCDLLPYQEKLTEYGMKKFSGLEFCSILQSLSQIEAFNILPYYKFKDSKGQAQERKLGPFELGKEIGSADWKWNDEDFRFALQNAICKEQTPNADMKNTRISAVLRAFPSSMPADTARSRTGISSTLYAEGTWDSTSGKLCMIGCPPGVIDSHSGLEGCYSQISLFIPQVYTLKQRSFMLGAISFTAAKEKDQFFPLLFDSVLRPLELHRILGLRSTSYYNYSVIELATAIRSGNLPSKAFTLFRQLFLKYPGFVDTQDSLAQLNHLSVNLLVHARASFHQPSNKYNSRIVIYMEVLSLGSLFARRPQRLKNLTSSQLLNVSMQLMFNEGPELLAIPSRDISPLFLEGVYDPLAGVMHLVGCKKIANGTVSVIESVLELDCLVEVKVQYPSETGRWLKNPSVEIFVTSQRKKDDPLHFNPITLRAGNVLNLNHQHDVVFRKLSEGFLRILLCLGAIGIILSQFSYMSKNAGSIPYISLVMLAEQILGYCVELLRAPEIIFESKESESYRNSASINVHDHDEHQFLMRALEFPARLLVLTALLLTARLYQKVSEAKRRPDAYGSNKPRSLNKRVILWNLKIHVAICVIPAVLLMPVEIFLRSLHLEDYFLVPVLLMKQVEMHMIWAHDLFLLPQILENSKWKIQVKPLRKMYYVGLTWLRLMIYVYDYIRDPILAQYESDGFNKDTTDLFSIFGIPAVPIFMVVLATVVHIQQNWNYLKSPIYSY